MAQTKRIPTTEEDRPLIRKKPNLERVADIEKNLKSLKRNETSVKRLISVLTFDLLMEFEGGSTDIGKVNRMLNAASPINKKYLVLFFQHFLPWKYDKANGNFTRKISGEDRIKAKMEDISRFLSDCLEDHSRDFWHWVTENTKEPAAVKPYADRIQNLVKQALNPSDKQKEKGLVALTPAQVIEAVLASDGISVDDLAAVLEANPAPVKTEQPANSEEPEAEPAAA